MSATVQLQRRTTLRGERRREELLGAVVDHVLEHGLRDFSLRRAAAEAGTSHRILLYHFGTTSELLREVLAEIRRPVIEAARAALRQPDADPMTTAWEILSGKLPVTRVLMEVQMLSTVDESYREIAQDYMSAYLPVVEEAIATGVDGRRRKDAAALILAVIRGLLLDVRSTGELERAWRAFELFAEMGSDAGLLVGVRRRDDR
jgi:AcrR family transcriptional regulator